MTRVAIVSFLHYGGTVILAVLDASTSEAERAAFKVQAGYMAAGVNAVLTIHEIGVSTPVSVKVGN
jgi:hypothetical protein